MTYTATRDGGDARIKLTNDLFETLKADGQDIDRDIRPNVPAEDTGYAMFFLTSDVELSDGDVVSEDRQPNLCADSQSVETCDALVMSGGVATRRLGLQVGGKTAALDLYKVLWLLGDLAKHLTTFAEAGALKAENAPPYLTFTAGEAAAQMRELANTINQLGEDLEGARMQAKRDAA